MKRVIKSSMLILSSGVGFGIAYLVTANNASHHADELNSNQALSTQSEKLTKPTQEGSDYGDSANCTSTRASNHSSLIERNPTLDDALKGLSAGLLITNRIIRHHNLYSNISQYNATELEALIKKIGESELNSTDQTSLRLMLLRRWAELSPMKSMQWLKNSKWSYRKDYESIILSSWASHDTKGVTQYLETRPHSLVRNRHILMIAEELAQADVDRAIDWIDEHASGTLKLEAISEVIGQAAETDIDAALDLLSQLVPGTNKDDAIKKVVKHWAHHTPQAALAWIDQLPNTEGKDKAWGIAVSRLMTLQPAPAIDYITATNPNDLMDSTVFLQTVEKLGELDPVASLNWAKQVENKDDYKMTVTSMFHNLAHNSLENATQFIQTLPQGSEEKGWLIDYVVEAKANSDINDALLWVASLPNEQERAKAMEATIMNIVTYAPERMNHYLNQLVQQHPSDPSITQLIASSWANTVPNQNAVEWVLSKPLDAKSKNMLRDVIGGWIERNHFEAARWIESLDNGPAKLIAATELVKSFSAIDTEIAEEWANLIDDPIHRERALMQDN